MSAYTSAALLDLAAALSFIAFIWGWLALVWKASVRTLDFLLDEIDIYFDRKYPDVL